MRALATVLLLSALALAGCTQGSPGRGDDFQPTCPSWTKSLSTTVFQGPGWFHPNGTNVDAWDHNDTAPFGRGQLSLQGHPLDFVELDFNVKRNHTGGIVRQNGTPVQQFLFVDKGVLQVEFLRNGTREPLLAYDSSRGPPGASNPPSETLTWESGLYTNFTIHVQMASPSQPADPDPFFMHWTLLGPRTGNGDTSAWALREMTAYFWYRTCNADNSPATA